MAAQVNDVEPDDPWLMVSRAPSARTSKEDLLEQVRLLQGVALRERERAIGVQAELDVANEKLQKLRDTPLAKAFKRVDKLEEQREQLLHRLRLGRFGEEMDDEIAALKASATWRAGRMVIAPVTFVKSRIRRT